MYFAISCYFLFLLQSSSYNKILSVFLLFEVNYYAYTNTGYARFNTQEDRKNGGPAINFSAILIFTNKLDLLFIVL
jgi:hypothetical protein